MTFTRVGDLLTKRRNLYAPENRIIDAVTVINAWPQIIAEVKCIEKFQRTRVLSYRKGILTVQAASSAIASELKMCESRLIGAYNKRFKTMLIEKIVIRRN